MCFGYDTNCIWCWGFGSGECRVPIHCYYSQVHYDPEWYYMLGSSSTSQKIYLKRISIRQEYLIQYYSKRFLLRIGTWSYNCSLTIIKDQSAGSVKYCISSREERIHATHECPGYDTKQSNSDEDLVILELREMQSTPSLLSLPGPLWHGPFHWSNKLFKNY